MAIVYQFKQVDNNEFVQENPLRLHLVKVSNRSKFSFFCTSRLLEANYQKINQICRFNDEAFSIKQENASKAWERRTIIKHC